MVKRKPVPDHCLNGQNPGDFDMLKIGDTFTHCGKRCTVTGFRLGKVLYRTPEGFTGEIDAKLLETEGRI